MPIEISQVGAVRCKLGEGPIWDPELALLYFVDVLGQRLWRHDPADMAFDSWELPARISSIALIDPDHAIVALATGLHRFDLGSAALESIGDPCASAPETFLNDGKVDAVGRFIVGSVQPSGDTPLAALFSLGPDDRITRLDAGFRISNGPCWSADGATFYVADSVAQSIYAYDYEQSTGRVANRRLFADTSGIGGIPDGATIDARGRLWTAMCDGGSVVCIDNGVVVEKIAFPTGFVSSVMFGGADLDRLYVTSIDGSALGEIAAASGARHAADDLGGRLFVIDGLGVKGRPEVRFRAARGVNSGEVRSCP